VKTQIKSVSTTRNRTTASATPSSCPQGAEGAVGCVNLARSADWSSVTVSAGTRTCAEHLKLKFPGNFCLLLAIKHHEDISSNQKQSSGSIPVFMIV
jgi:hypothetical protein